MTRTQTTMSRLKRDVQFSSQACAHVATWVASEVARSRVSPDQIRTVGLKGGLHGNAAGKCSGSVSGGAQGHCKQRNLVDVSLRLFWAQNPMRVFPRDHHLVALLVPV